eukprot:gnl/TRDRNA2_/TRDRNA2_81181_c0_seq1.p1 gnl/TRDRNA2_/TRDRNA2_81181_c0~~gnl/TRDRNA2_/TRDRNA2_81181_c0_seq1.p1  ORF type:complete len:399 (-),score=107.45 gnl/TRDRNA2_/TRDRNA2_81181_c0_seq1:66-1262(-)
MAGLSTADEVNSLPVALVDEAGTIRRFELRIGEKERIRAGRTSKHDIYLSLAGISSNHMELKMLPSPPDENGIQRRLPILGIRDLSMNGTGIRQSPDLPVQRLEKDVDTKLESGALILVPMRIPAGKEKQVEAVRKCFSVHYGDIKEELLTPPQMPGSATVNAGSQELPRPAAKQLTDMPPPTLPAKAKPLGGFAAQLSQLSQSGESAASQSEKTAEEEAEAKRPRKNLPPVPVLAPATEAPAGAESVEEPEAKRPKRLLPPVPVLQPTAPVVPPASAAPIAAEQQVPPTPSSQPRGAAAKSKPKRPRPPVEVPLPPELQSKLDKGEALIREGRSAEDQQLLDEAYDDYIQGLGLVVEVLVALAAEDPKKGALQQKVGGYIERTIKFKEKRERLITRD